MAIRSPGEGDDLATYDPDHPPLTHGVPDPTTTPTTTTTTGTADPQALWNQYRLEHPSFHPRQSEPTSLQPFLDWAKTQGADLSLAAPSSGGYVKGILLNGQFVKLLDGTDNPIWQVGEDAAAGPAPPSIDPSYLRPFTTSFGEFAPSAVGTGGSDLNPPAFRSPGPFQQPTGDSILQDPSFQFRMDQGRGQIENSAAARGTLNTGGTLSDILNYGQKAASQEYSNIWNRDFGLWNTNWDHALGEYATNAGANDTAYSRAFNQFLTNRDTFYQNQSRPFDKLFAGAQLGAGAAA